MTHTKNRRPGIGSRIAATAREAGRQLRTVSLVLHNPWIGRALATTPAPIPAPAAVPPIAEWSRERRAQDALAVTAPTSPDFAAALDRHEVLIGTPEAARLLR